MSLLKRASAASISLNRVIRLAALGLFLALFSCATKEQKIENRDIEQLYQGAGVERYFLPDLPVWANFSSSSNCRREELVRYLNFDTLRDSYALNYDELVHFQHMLNRRFQQAKSDSDKQLYLKDEAFIFYNVYEQVAGGGKDFLTPQFSRISLVWIDPYLDDLSRVEKILEMESVGQGHPVLVSACMSSLAMEKAAGENGWDSFGVKLISQEMFTPYTSNLKLGKEFTLDFSLFLPNKELRLFAPRLPKKTKSMPTHFKGINRVIEI